MPEITEIGKRAKAAAGQLAWADTKTKNTALLAMAEALTNGVDAILAANAEDMARAQANGMSPAMQDRLRLTTARIAGMAKGIEDIAGMNDPVGRVLWGETNPNGMRMQKVSVPLGVIAVIYEARPNVTADAAALCLKAGNAVILKGGSDAISSNKAVADLLRGAVTAAGLPEDCIQLVEDTSRQTAQALMRMNEYVDVLIPRGGAGLIRAVVEQSTVPVIETGVGNCHVYVDKDADLAMAAEIIYNAKCSRPSVCNACESILIHKDIADKALPLIWEKLKEKNVQVRGDETVCTILSDATPATQEDWGKEYLDYILSAKVVADVDEAIAHIATYGTGHSECIVTENYTVAQRFQIRVDAAAVYVNASTRFTDGGEFGFGAEIGISTQKLHARGPLGLANLTSEKYLISGSGQIR